MNKTTFVWQGYIYIFTKHQNLTPYLSLHRIMQQAFRFQR